MAQYKAFFICGVLLIISLHCFAQNEKTPPLQFENYTGGRVLAHGSIASFMKDHKGFLWIGSSDGLNRFDGYDLKTFRNNPADSTTISAGWQYALAEDKNGIIWVSCTMAQGLNAYDPATGKFKRYSDNPVYKKLLPDNLVYFIFIDDDNRLWISTDREGLYNFDPATNKTVIYKNNPQDPFSLHDNSPGNICRADKDHLYISVDGGFDLLDIRSGRCRHFRTYSKSFPWKKFSIEFIIEHPDMIFKDSKNNLWICTFEGLKMFDPATEKFTTYRHHAEDLFSISSDTLNDICQSPDGRLWITANNGDLDVFTPVVNKFFHYHLQTENLPALVNSWLAYDASGKIWMYNNFYAIAINLLPDKFQLYTHDAKNKNSISWNMGEYIYQDNHGKIFVGTLHGLNVFDPVSKSFQLYQPHPAINDLLDDNNVEFISQDNTDTYWMEVDEQKLISYNPHTHQSSIYNYNEHHDPDSLGVFSIYDMYEDSNGTNWFGGLLYLCSFNPVTKKFKTYQTEPGKPEVPFANNFNRIMNFNDGKIWLVGAGISYYEPLADKIYRVKFKDKKNNIDEWANGNFLGALVDGNKMVWLGTMGQGLYMLDLTTGRHRRYTMHDGLPSDIIWDLSKDDHGNLWLATNNGLCRFTPPKNVFDENEKAVYRIYNMNDGIPGNEFGVQLYRKFDDGTIMCGTLSSNPGMISFHPDSLKDNDFIPPVYITGFSLFNKEVIPFDSNNFLKSTIESTKEITLSYKENVFSFTFAALSFVHPENNHYAYKLENFDKDWIYTDASKRFANYTNLDAGEYIFKVRGSNNDGIWNPKEASIKIIITPPFWETWWFRLFIIAAIASAVYLLYRNRIHQLLQLQRIRNKIAGDLHDDIGSTLSSISIFTELAKKQSKEVTPLLDQIAEHSRRMLDSMADIVWTINPENDNFEKIILRMRSFAYDLLGAKNIEFEFNADESTEKLKLPMTVRKNLYLIFKEASNNMAKYSEASRAMFSLSYAGKQLKFLVRDNGKGFDLNKITQGNGLKSMQRRAKEIGAKLIIESEAGTGTFIELLIAI